MPPTVAMFFSEVPADTGSAENYPATGVGMHLARVVRVDVELRHGARQAPPDYAPGGTVDRRQKDGVGRGKLCNPMDALQFPVMGRSKVGPSKHCPLVGWLSRGKSSKGPRILRSGELKPSRGSEISDFIFLAGTEVFRGG